jgi:hypothetical protein
MQRKSAFLASLLAAALIGGGALALSSVGRRHQSRCHPHRPTNDEELLACPAILSSALASLV